MDTIVGSDRILAINDGVVAEYDRPDVLLENPESIFYELCMNTGRAQFKVLFAKARAHASENEVNNGQIVEKDSDNDSVANFDEFLLFLSEKEDCSSK